MDADMSHNPREIKNKIKLFEEKNLDLLISSRYSQKSKIINWPASRQILSYLSNKLSKTLLNVPITDYTNGYNYIPIMLPNMLLNVRKNWGWIYSVI